MAFDSLAGFLTRPDAGRIYNRSQRTLERDLDNALRMGDSDALKHWKLQTKDGEIRGAESVTIAQVKELQSDGQVPVWYIREAFLAERYGRRGESKPTRKPVSVKPDDQNKLPAKESTAEAVDVNQSRSSINEDLGFLRERIRTLEQEKQEEILRNQNREEKLFEQLAVKDRQISAWDELTQGLTRALATGQIKPDVSVMLTSKYNADTNLAQKDDPVEVVSSATPNVTQPVSTVKRRERNTKESVKEPSNTRKSEKKLTQAPRWYHTPTLAKLLTRK